MIELKSKFDIIAEYYQEHLDELKAFVIKRIGYSEDAEDIVQNIFVRLLSSDKMITITTMPCLVYTIARNLIYDYWRRHHSQDEYIHYFNSGNGINDESQSVYSVTEVRELLERGIAHLSTKKRNIYKMSIYEGLKVSEISQTLGENYKSVENYLGAARKEVREYMNRMLA